MSVYYGEHLNPYLFRGTPDPWVLDQQTPLVYENFISNTYTPPPDATFNERFPSEDMFQPQSDPFVDRFYFSDAGYMFNFGFGVNGAADGGRFDHIFAAHHDIA